jgi:alkylation response protein AidB-like acyl-CoA dehydrogenase
MNFDLDDDERALQQGIRELCRGRAPSDRIRAAAGTSGVDRDLFLELGEAGVFALTLPEDRGGLGLGATHATVVFEELGRALVPGPLVATHLGAVMHVGGAQSGKTIVTSIDEDGSVITHLSASDVIVVVGDLDLFTTEPAEFIEIANRSLRPLDPLTPVHTLTHEPQKGSGLAYADDALRWRRHEKLLNSALLLGNALGSLELATAYAKQREQFGRPIGSFQAVKHLLADALTRAEVARAAVYAAACHLDDPDLGDVDTALAGAALLAADAAIKNGKTSIQVHGGMGFTWEVDAHLYLKRATVLAAAVGGVAANEERMAESLM